MNHDPEPGSVQGVVFAVVVLATAVGGWFGTGWILDRFEFVRLLSYSNSQRTVKLRFATPELARRAREVLVLAELPDKSHSPADKN